MWSLAWCRIHFSFLMVVSAILGQNINDHIHLIFPHDQLAAHIFADSLCSEVVDKNKWYHQPRKTKINSIPTNQRQGGLLLGFLLHSSEVTSPYIADATFSRFIESTRYLNAALLNCQHVNSNLFPNVPVAQLTPSGQALGPCSWRYEQPSAWTWGRPSCRRRLEQQCPFCFRFWKKTWVHHISNWPAAITTCAFFLTLTIHGHQSLWGSSVDTVFKMRLGQLSISLCHYSSCSQNDPLIDSFSGPSGKRGNQLKIS